MKCENCGTAFIQHKTGQRVRVCKACRRTEYSRKKHLRRSARRRAGDPRELVRRRRAQARRRGLEFTLTVKTFPPIPEVCPVFGLPFGERLGRPELDRIDSTKGYVPGNVQWISSLANRIKSDATAAEVAAVSAFLLKHELVS